MPLFSERSYHLLTHLLIALFVIGLIAAPFFISDSDKPTFKGIKIKFKEQTTFTSETEIKQALEKILLTAGRNIKLSTLEKLLLQTLPFIESAHACRDLRDNLLIVVREKQVIARLILPSGTQMLLAENGSLLPVRPSPVPLPVVITRTKPDSEETLQEIVKVVEHISADKSINSLTATIVRDSQGIFYIIPIVGSSLIKMGRAEYVPTAISKLKKFLRFLAINNLLENYRTIDLTYKKQIIAQRRQP